MRAQQLFNSFVLKTAISMESLGKHHTEFLQLLVKLDRKQCKAVLFNLTRDQTILIGELAANLLAGNIRIGGEDKNDLKKNRRIIRHLAEERATPTQRLSIIKKNPLVVTKLIKAVLKTLNRKKR